MTKTETRELDALTKRLRKKALRWSKHAKNGVVIPAIVMTYDSAADEVEKIVKKLKEKSK